MLIVLEGGDGSGKSVQTAKLDSALAEQGRVEVFDFPQYTASPAGRIIRRALDGEFGNFLGLSPYLAVPWYMLDRLNALPRMREALRAGHVICNRWVTSNIAHQMAKLPAWNWPDFIAFNEQMEYDELGLPRPGLVIFLDVPPEHARRLRSAGRRTTDQHEASDEYQQTVYAAYQYLADSAPSWATVACCSPEGVLHSPDEIHRRVMEIVTAHVATWAREQAVVS